MAGTAATAGGARSAPLPPERWNNIFAPDQGMEIRSRLTESRKGPEALSRTRYVLLGTIASADRTSRRAILWAEGMREPSLVREQAELERGVRLTRIERDLVVITRGGESETIEILPVGARTRAATPAAPTASATPAASPAPAGGGEIRVTRLGENAFSLDESTVAQITGNINQYMTNVRLIPYFEGNKSAGYRIAAIRPGSAFEQLGFKGGDVIQQVNNLDLSSPDKMYTIFQNLKDEKKVTVNIVRQGQKNTITYEIR
jgi:general secretion pathway protein C